MLDKAHGTITVFERGNPTFSGAALTGENPADYLAPDAIGKTFAEQNGYKYKVTPAGRYTVSVGFDPAYGETLDINEIQGVDWDIAIHKVWLGAPSEHRDPRLRSSSDQDKHITYGCIDVFLPTMAQIMRRRPDQEQTPIYILPEDERLVPRTLQGPRRRRESDERPRVDRRSSTTIRRKPKKSRNTSLRLGVQKCKCRPSPLVRDFIER